MRVEKVCKSCGSENVKKDAWASWNTETQRYELDEFFDENDFCVDCDSSTTIIEKEI